MEPPGAPPFDASLGVAWVLSRNRAFLLWTLQDVTPYRSMCREVQAERDRLHDLSAHCLRAREEEARRIAHQLHDEAAQITATIHLALAEIGRDISRPELPRLAKARALLDMLEARLRHLSHELRPTILDDLGLAPALCFLAERFESRTGIPVAVKGSLRKGRLSPIVETTVYRIVQEALSNIARHARALRAWIRLGEGRSYLNCSIRDNGVGFDPSSAKGDAGLGLLGIRERLGALGGLLEVRSSAGCGTDLRVAIPLRRRECLAGSFSPTITSSSGRD